MRMQSEALGDPRGRPHRASQHKGIIKSLVRGSGTWLRSRVGPRQVAT